jgi:hypothetical protein
MKTEEEFYTNAGRPISTVKGQLLKKSGDYILLSVRTSNADG